MLNFFTRVAKIFAIIFFFCTASSQAKPYFAADSISPNFLNPPPEIGSEQYKKEIQQIVKLQKNFDLNELDQALAEKHLRPETIAEFIDPKLTRASFPKLYFLLDRSGETSYETTQNIKNFWNKTRPYLTDKKVKMLIEPSGGKSYPSGHATGSYLYANILGILFPQKREAFQNYAEKISQRRVLVGMHYPSDILAGEKLALLILDRLKQNSDFEKNFEAARREIAGR